MQYSMDQISMAVYEMLFRQDFTDWEDTDFLDHIEGEEGCKSKEEILWDIYNMMNRAMRHVLEK